MRFKGYLKEALKFVEDVTGTQSGQTDISLIAYMDKEVAGWIDYSDYMGEISIKMIEVKPEYRRQGIGKKLLLELQRRYPKTEIQLGMLTGDGAKLVKSVKLYVDKARIKKIKSLEKEMADLKKEEVKLIKKLDLRNYKDKKELYKIGDRLNDISDRIYEIEEELREL